MKISFASSFLAGSQAAHAINTVKSAASYVDLGHDTHLITRRATSQSLLLEDLRHIYGVRTLPSWLMTPKWCRKHLLFGLAAAHRIKRLQPDLVIARDYASSVFASRLGFPTVMETHAHAGATDRWLRWALRDTCLPSFRAVITISETLRNYYIDLGAIPEKIIVLPTGVNIDAFSRPAVLPDSPFQETASEGRQQAVYVGHLYDWKGIPTIIEASRVAPLIDFHIIGGNDDDITRTKQQIKAKQLSNVYVHGRKDQSQLPPYLWHADVLLLPPSAHHPSAKWTSPVKLGEYLASGTPVVATEIPALKNWLKNDDVEFVAPDAPTDLVAGIKRVVENPTRAMKLSERGLIIAQQWAYSNRAKRIIAAAGLSDDEPI